MKARRWHRIAQQYLILNSILVAVSGVILAEDARWPWLCFATLALLLFLFEAEMIVEALRKESVEQFVRYPNAYNWGVTFFLIALVGSLIDRADLGIFWGTLAIVATTFVWYRAWGRDLLRLLHKTNRERLREDYELDVVPRD
jgi:hypothetical protein